MGAITIRMTDNMLAYVEEQAAYAGYPDGEAFLQALVMDHHAAKMAALHAAIEEGEASGYLEGDGLEIVRRTIAEARERYRSSGA